MPHAGSGGGGNDMDPSAQYAHPPLHRVHSQATGVTMGPSSGGSGRMYNSRGSDGAVSSRHSLDSGMRQYEGGDGSRHPGSGKSAGSGGGGVSYNSGGAGAGGGPGQSMASNSGSGSGSSGLSAHDTRSIGAWSAPPGRSGGGVGTVGGGGGSWAAEHETPRSSFRGDGSGDEEDMMYVTPAFGAPHRRRSTGGGGGPVVGGGGGIDSRDSFVRGGSDLGLSGGGGGDRGQQGSDLGSAGSPQFGSSRASGGLLGGLWAGTFPSQDLSPQAPSDQAEVCTLYFFSVLLPPCTDTCFGWCVERPHRVFCPVHSGFVIAVDEFDLCRRLSVQRYTKVSRFA